MPLCCHLASAAGQATCPKFLCKVTCGSVGRVKGSEEEAIIDVAGNGKGRSEGNRKTLFVIN